MKHPIFFALIRVQLSAALLLSLLSACAPTRARTQPVSLTVFAAASLTGAFTQIGQSFETAHPGVTVTFNFAGSQQLAQQLSQGAAADVFASANQQQMDTVAATGRIDKTAVRMFAQNRLVVIYPQGNPAGIASLADLAKPGLRLVLAAKEVPVGAYTLEFLAKAAADPAFSPSFQADVLKNVVSYEDNVKVVLAKVSLGEADAGVVYTSDVASALPQAKDSAQVGELAIPDNLNVVAVYPLAPLADSPHLALAQAFVDLALSPEGQAVLAQAGFIPVENKP